MIATKTSKLGDLVNIRTGYSFRKKIHDDPFGSVHVINMRDLINDYTAIGNESTFHKVGIEGSIEKHILKEKEILFVAKGPKNRALLFNKSYKAVATSIFLILSIKEEYELEPEYITWYLNQKDAQKDLSKMLTGSVQRNINGRALRDLEIPIPSIEKQRMIGKLGFLLTKERELISSIREKRNWLIQSTLLNDLSND